jgi:aminoglycoside phosphotransferase (APT) family kinase protein
VTDSFLRQRHATYTMSEQVLRELVADTAGRTASAFEPVVRGYANEVYRVRLVDGAKVIVRIQRYGGVDLAHEAWAMSRCLAVGVPVPHVYGVKPISTGGSPCVAMVMQQVAGRPLAEVMPELTEAQRRRVFSTVGSALRTMHSIAVDGYGRLGSKDTSASWTDHTHKLIAERRRDIPLLVQAGLTDTEAAGLIAMIESLSDFAPAQPLLCHGDLSTEHIFVDDALDLTAIIDFGMCRGGPGTLDVAILLMFHPEVELAWLAEGYGDDLRPSLPLRREILAHQVNIGMSYLAHDMREGNGDSTDIAQHVLRQWLATWSTF